MKRINEILKELNFPKFYEKFTEEDGSTYYVFDNFVVREYNKEDCKLFLENLPFTQDTIHEDDVNFITQYLEYCIDVMNMTKDVKDYFLKMMDKMPLGGSDESLSKVLTILRNPELKKIAMKIDKDLDKDESVRKLFGKSSCNCHGHDTSATEVKEKIIEPVIEMLGTITEGLVKTIEKNIPKEKKVKKMSKKEQNTKEKKTSKKVMKMPIGGFSDYEQDLKILEMDKRIKKLEKKLRKTRKNKK
jgi:hypothetical protein